MSPRLSLLLALVLSFAAHASVLEAAHVFIAPVRGAKLDLAQSPHWVTYERSAPVRRKRQVAQPASAPLLTEGGVRGTSLQEGHRQKTARFSHDSPYFLEIQRLISDRKAYPRLSAQKGEQGTVEVEFEIDEAGRVSALRLKKPSVHDRLNIAALDLLADFGQLPPPPSDFSSFPVKVSLPITYRLH